MLQSSVPSGGDVPSGSAEAQQAAMLRATSISGEPKRVRNAGGGAMEACAGAEQESVLVHHSGGPSSSSRE